MGKYEDICFHSVYSTCEFIQRFIILLFQKTKYMFIRIKESTINV